MTVAELVVKLSAVGGDEVKRKLNETEKDLKKTAKAAEETKKPFEDLEIAGINVATAMQNAGKMFAQITPEMAIIGAGAGLATVAVIGFTAAMVGLSAASYKVLFNSRQAGIEFESMKARLEGLTGSAKRAKEMLALAQREAGPSMFTTQQLEQSMVSLAAYGQNVERVLPMITKLGQGMGADQERLMMYTRAMNMLKQGQMPDTEVMGAMGISKADMRKKGVKFDEGGSLVSSAEDAMVAIEKIIDEKYGNALKKAANTTESMQASITDALQNINRQFGEITNTALKPFIGMIGDIAKMISESKFPGLFASELMAPLQALFGIGGDLKSVFLDVLATLAAMANVIPRNLTNLIIQIKDIQREKNLITKAGMIGELAYKFTLGGLYEGGVSEGYAFGEDFKKFRKALETKRTIDKVADDRKKDPFGAGGDIKDKTGKTAKDVKGHLQKIESNTKKSADLLDLRRQTLGGGEMGRLGITGAELAGMGMNYRSEITKIKPIRGDTMVTRGIKNMIQNNILFAVNGGQGMPVR